MKTIIDNDAARVGAWCAQRAGFIVHPTDAAIGLERDGKLIAGVVYQDYNGVNIAMHVAAEGKNWLCREYLWFCFYYPFVQLGVKRVTGMTAGNNEIALRFQLNLGFEREFTMKDAHPDGDLVILKMTRDKCKWLNLRKHHAEKMAA